MGSDARTVATDALATLGTIIDETAARDAVHVATEPALAGHRVKPGDHVGKLPDGRFGHCDKPLGIVDPYLDVATVKPGERFWLLLYPKGISSLRHVWTHPDFDEPQLAPKPMMPPTMSTMTTTRTTSISPVTGVLNIAKSPEPEEKEEDGRPSSSSCRGCNS